MQLPLFKALQSIKIDDDRATEVVVALEEHTAMKIAEANAPLIAELKGVKAQIGALKWMIGLFGSVMAVIGLAPAVFHLFK